MVVGSRTVCWGGVCCELSLELSMSALVSWLCLVNELGKRVRDPAPPHAQHDMGMWATQPAL